MRNEVQIFVEALTGSLLATIRVAGGWGGNAIDDGAMSLHQILCGKGSNLCRSHTRQLTRDFIDALRAAVKQRGM
jgi:hypothetical protein